MLICVYNVNVEAKTFNNLRVEGMMVAAVVGVRPAIGNPHSTCTFSCLSFGKTLHPPCLLVVVRGPSGTGTW